MDIAPLSNGLRPRVIADANIPFLPKLLGDSVKLVRLPPAEITPEAVRDADALITRTRTRCDAHLLDNSRCQFIATATIGTDHIDYPYCHEHDIAVASAPGCNAPAVAQYVLSSVLRLTGDRNPAELTLGIVGVGHVGSIVERWGRALGFNLLLCDPPRAESEGSDKFATLDEIARRADIVTFHTPHTLDGPHATHHLADKRFFEAIERRPIIINSARGPIVDTPALIEAINAGKTGPVVIDCWEGEPDINLRLLEKATFATPHIAGYSAEGKARASLMAARAICMHFGLPFNPSIPVPADA
ncbi:MAG: 4-phosphoerythronate dehydrogenase, partial [Muribaculaceae bacterium]|nr:4-phosphoerythronate dehydrogenase [Muribaculaceae bacterium]